MSDRFIIVGVGDRKRQLADDVQFVAGVDPDDGKTPRLIPITSAGVKIDTTGGGLALPRYDYMEVQRYGSTNNIHYLVFKTGGSGGATVATLEFFYVGGGASNDDDLLSFRLL